MAALQHHDLTLTPPHGRPFLADIRFPADGTPKPVIVFLHGFKGFKDWGHFNLIADYIARHGFVFVKFNFSHNGVEPDGQELTDMEAFGNNNFMLELEDLQTVLDYLFGNNPFAEEMDLKKVFLAGHSRGAGIALIQAADDERVAGAATWAGISSFEQRWPEDVLEKWKAEGVHWIYNQRIQKAMPLYYQLYENYMANKEKLDVHAAVSRLHKPLLIIHGNADETLPVSMAHELQQFKPNATVMVVPGANHTFGGSHPFTGQELPEDARFVADQTVSFFTKNC